MIRTRFKLRLFSLLIVLAAVAVLWIPIGQRLEERLVLRSETLDESIFQALIAKSPDKAATLGKAWRSGKIPHRQAVARFLKESSDPLVFTLQSERILTAAARDGDSNVRELALAALASRKHPLVVSLAANQLHDPDPNLRLLALEYVRNQPTNIAEPLIGAVLDDADPVVAATAAVALQRFDGQDFGIRVAQVLDDRLNSEARQAFDAKFAQVKQWWSSNRESFQAVPAIELPAIDPGFEVSDFALQGPNGKTVRLSDFRGKTVLLNFWTTWCTACQAEFSILNELQTKHANDLVILGISLDGVADEHGDLPGHEEPDSVQPTHQWIQRDVARAVASHHLKYRILLDPKNKVGARFNGGELPTNVLIDPRGRFSRRFIGARRTDAFEAIILATSHSRD